MSRSCPDCCFQWAVAPLLSKCSTYTVGDFEGLTRKNVANLQYSQLCFSTSCWEQVPNGMLLYCEGIHYKPLTTLHPLAAIIMHAMSVFPPNPFSIIPLKVVPRTKHVAVELQIRPFSSTDITRKCRGGCWQVFRISSVPLPAAGERTDESISWFYALQHLCYNLTCEPRSRHGFQRTH